MTSPKQKLKDAILVFQEAEQLLKEAVDGFQEVNYRQVSVDRNQESYDITDQFIETEVRRLLEMYRGLTKLDQRARLIRDGIDLYLRRGHGYSIEGSIGSHYRQIGVELDNCIFEHMIPQSRIRDLLIQDRISIKQAMNPPTCLISKENDALLSKSGFNNKTPSYWHFFDRYTNIFDAEYETFNGQLITDTHNWTLFEHYKFFGII
jgi:hypothetical protein